MIEAQLLDRQQAVLGELHLEDRDGLYRGTVEFGAIPLDVLGIFEEFESYANDQILELVAEVEEKIAGLGLLVRLPDGHCFPVESAQIWPSTGRLSFRMSDPVPTYRVGQRSGAVS